MYLMLWDAEYFRLMSFYGQSCTCTLEKNRTFQSTKEVSHINDNLLHLMKDFISFSIHSTWHILADQQI